MVEYIKRLLLGIVMVIIITFLIIGSKQSIAKAEGLEKGGEGWIWPANGVITDTYGTRGGQHKGIDIAEVIGTPVYSVDNGQVTKSYYSDTYGNVVFIKHKVGYETVYAHLSDRKVQEGQHVKKGEIIGLMGNTGESSGPHLHFEIHKNEWTITKENSLDPTRLFGMGDVGQYVQAGTSNGKDVEVTKEIDMEQDKRNHTVKRGDTLWDIANKYETTVTKIKEWNGLKSERIIPGQEITIKQIN